jgi:hypothetical protein
MSRAAIKVVIRALGYEPEAIIERFDAASLGWALRESRLAEMVEQLEVIVPDITAQYSRLLEPSISWKLKVRGLHAFQVAMMLKALQPVSSRKITVVDIGDSAGTHMLYLKAFTRGYCEVDTISINLDPRAVEKIKARGLRAELCRAEDLDLPGLDIDLFTSFEMLEHLHNPAIFCHRLAKKSTCNKILITVPYRKNSRVGLHHLRNRSQETVFAEDTHIFELSPEDWTLLMLHAGWKVSHSEIYYQYPRKWPIISQLMATYWRVRDYEGFWGAILEKDLTFADSYQDWEE